MSEFKIIDLQKGGKEIALGTPANDILTQTQEQIGLFKCTMDTKFNDMTDQEVHNFIDALNITKINAVDYIVEQGISGIWTYRKWDSGNIELWGRYSATLSNYTTAFNGYGYYTTISLPFTVYTPVINYSVQIGSGFAIPGSALGYAGSASLSSFNVYAIANVSGSQSTVWVCDVKGKWK